MEDQGATRSQVNPDSHSHFTISAHISLVCVPTTSEKLALCFSPTECDEYLINGNHPLLRDDLRDWMYAITGGHIGAMVSISELISTASKSLIQHQRSASEHTAIIGRILRILQGSCRFDQEPQYSFLRPDT
ncbi:hypothetical protein QCA50_013520 [Cerrena zonata]|uniref:Uncharacterized protein n=1 Tax=Cerrena zonata TaxID=2478898 RepID=A0AAW0FNJ6_9APHY